MENVAAGLSTMNAVLAASVPAPASPANSSDPGGLGSVATGVSTPAVVAEAAARAGGVELGRIVHGTLAYPADDEYTFEGKEGQELVFYLQGLSGYGNPMQSVVYLELLNPTKNATLAGVGSQGTQETLDYAYTIPAVTLRQTGQYHIRVKGCGGKACDGPYRFVVLPVVRTPETIGSTVALGAIVEGEKIDRIFDVDEFSFAGVKGQQVIVRFQGLNGYGNPVRSAFELELLNPTKNATLALLGSQGTQEVLEDSATPPITLPETGRYTVRVTGCGANTCNGAYRFRVTSVKR